MKHLNSLFHTLALCAVVLFSHVQVSADGAIQIDGATVGHWTMDFDAAKELAAEKELPILINFTGSDWCGWCKLMDKKVFADEAWKEFSGEYALLVTIDFPKDKSIVPEKYVERNKALKAEFGVRGYPTYIILDSDGETRLGQLGASRDKTPESFIKEFEGVTRFSMANIQAFIDTNPDKAEAYKAAIEKFKASTKALSDWIATRPEQNDENMEKFKAFRKEIEAAEAVLADF